MALDPYRRKTKARSPHTMDGPPSGQSRFGLVMAVIGLLAMLGLLYNLGQIADTASQLLAWRVQSPP